VLTGRPGDILCHQTDAIAKTNTFTLKLLAFDHLTLQFVEILHGRLFSSGRIKALVATLDKATGKVAKKRPRVLAPGTLASVIIEATDALPIEAGMRVILRADGETVGAGIVESTE
jgi:elongation factor 1 alpha-like protein